MKKIICLVLSFLVLLSSVTLVNATEAQAEKYVYRNNTYDFAILDKDPMTITDEEFFGQYDRYGNEIIAPYFKYDEFPEMAKVKEAKMGIQEQIIESAGQIYNYLNAKGEVSISKMKKDLSLNENFAEMGLGWLSREDKLEYTQKAKSVTVKLR